jgi:ArsR family transcriptional regulator
MSSVDHPVQDISRLLALIGQSARVQILYVISAREACVCHLEAYLGLRQAAISQHLMLLRDAGLVSAAREGRNIYYSLARPDLTGLIEQAALLSGLAIETVHSQAAPLSPCPCPHCNPESDPNLSCSNLREERA